MTETGGKAQALASVEFVTDEQGRLLAEIPCVACAYNLRTMHVDAACPECGTAVGRSLAGDRLRFCDPAWLRRIWQGLNCLAVMIGLWLIVGPVSLMTDGAEPGWLSAGALAVGAVLWVMGVVKASSPDPSGIDREPLVSARRLARVMLVAWMAILVMAIALAPYADFNGVWVGLGLAVTGIAGAAILLWHAARLAQRLPNRALAALSRAVAIGLAITGLLATGTVLPMMDRTWIAWLPPASWGPAYARWTHALYTCTTWTLLACAAGTMILFLWYWLAMRKAAEYARQTWARESSAATGRGSAGA